MILVGQLLETDIRGEVGHDNLVPRAFPLKVGEGTGTKATHPSLHTRPKTIVCSAASRQNVQFLPFLK